MGVLRVGVLGAGVVGLNTALEMQAEFPTAQFTVIADKFNTETTSDGAAGLFRPSSYFSGPDLDTTKCWVADSYRHYDELRTSGRGEACGIFQIDGYDFSNRGPVRCRLMGDVVPLYRRVTQEELDAFPENWKYGAFMRTLIIENRFFQPWAMARFQQAGGKVVVRSVASFQEVAADFDVLVNCTGLGSRSLCQDFKLNPIRGQVIKVRAPWVKKFYMNDYDGYIIPNRDTVTLGGTRHFASYDLRVSETDKSEIWRKCVSMEPSLSRAEFVRDWVGLRPHRDPVRVEATFLQVAGGRQLPVVHNYGHGGYGVTTAPGTAKHATRLLRQALTASRGSSKL